MPECPEDVLYTEEETDPVSVTTEPVGFSPSFSELTPTETDFEECADDLIIPDVTRVSLIDGLEHLQERCGVGNVEDPDLLSVDFEFRTSDSTDDYQRLVADESEEILIAQRVNTSTLRAWDISGTSETLLWTYNPIDDIPVTGTSGGGRGLFYNRLEDWLIVSTRVFNANEDSSLWGIYIQVYDVSDMTSPPVFLSYHQVTTPVGGTESGGMEMRSDSRILYIAGTANDTTTRHFLYSFEISADGLTITEKDAVDVRPNDNAGYVSLALNEDESLLAIVLKRVDLQTIHIVNVNSSGDLLIVFSEIDNDLGTGGPAQGIEWGKRDQSDILYFWHNRDPVDLTDEITIVAQQVGSSGTILTRVGRINTGRRRVASVAYFSIGVDTGLPLIYALGSQSLLVIDATDEENMTLKGEENVITRGTGQSLSFAYGPGTLPHST